MKRRSGATVTPGIEEIDNHKVLSCARLLRHIEPSTAAVGTARETGTWKQRVRARAKVWKEI